MGFSRQAYWEWVAIPSSRGPGIDPGVLHGRQILYRLIHQGNLLAILKTVPLHSKSVWGKIPKHCVNEALNSQAGEGIPQRPQ